MGVVDMTLEVPGSEHRAFQLDGKSRFDVGHLLATIDTCI